MKIAKKICSMCSFPSILSAPLPAQPRRGKVNIPFVFVVKSEFKSFWSPTRQVVFGHVLLRRTMDMVILCFEIIDNNNAIMLLILTWIISNGYIS